MQFGHASGGGIGGGLIDSAVPGRTDKHPIGVPAGSYVLPADIPSALGQGNTAAGAEILGKMFGTGPLGMKTMRPPGASLRARMPPPRSPLLPRNRFKKFADGGEVDQPQEQEHIPIVAAGGEFIVPPETVLEIGNGNIGHGHRVLDAFVLKVRNQHIKTLRGLSPPKK